jgi:hypothetical protein
LLFLSHNLIALFLFLLSVISTPFKLSKGWPRLNFNHAWDGGRWTYGLHVLYAVLHYYSLSRANNTLVANNFWGKDDAGLQPMLDRMHNSKVTNDELKVFYNRM